MWTSSVTWRPLGQKKHRIRAEISSDGTTAFQTSFKQSFRRCTLKHVLKASKGDNTSKCLRSTYEILVSKHGWIISSEWTSIFEQKWCQFVWNLNKIDLCSYAKSLDLLNFSWCFSKNLLSINYGHRSEYPFNWQTNCVIQFFSEPKRK